MTLQPCALRRSRPTWGVFRSCSRALCPRWPPRRKRSSTTPGSPVSRRCAAASNAKHGALTEASPPPIGRVIPVERPTIEPDIRAETARLDEPLRAVVTMLAERLERAEPELVDIAPMRLDVITDLRRRDNASLQAILAKRMREQLVPPDPRPAPRAIPSVPLRRLAANTHNSQPLHLTRLIAIDSPASLRASTSAASALIFVSRDPLGHLSRDPLGHPGFCVETSPAVVTATCAKIGLHAGRQIKQLLAGPRSGTRRCWLPSA